MATLRNKRKLAPLNRENCDERPRSYLSRNSIVPRSQEEYISQVSGEIEGRVTKLSQEFSGTENRILGALSRLYDFLMNPLIHGHSRTAPEASRNANGTNQGTNGDDSHSDPHPEASTFQSQRTRNSGPDDAYEFLVIRTFTNVGSTIPRMMECDVSCKNHLYFIVQSLDN